MISQIIRLCSGETGGAAPPAGGDSWLMDFSTGNVAMATMSQSAASDDIIFHGHAEGRDENNVAGLYPIRARCSAAGVITNPARSTTAKIMGIGNFAAMRLSPDSSYGTYLLNLNTTALSVGGWPPTAGTTYRTATHRFPSQVAMDSIWGISRPGEGISGEIMSASSVLMLGMQNFLVRVSPGTGAHVSTTRLTITGGASNGKLLNGISLAKNSTGTTSYSLFSVSNSPNQCMLVALAEPGGTLSWARHIGTAAGQLFTGICVAAERKAAPAVYVLYKSTENSRWVTLISKYNSTGTLQWTRQLSHASSDVTGTHCTVAADDSIYVTGLQGTESAFIVKLSSAGAMTWQRVVYRSANPMGIIDSHVNATTNAVYITIAMGGIGNYASVILKLTHAGAGASATPRGSYVYTTNSLVSSSPTIPNPATTITAAATTSQPTANPLGPLVVSAIGATKRDL